MYHLHHQCIHLGYWQSADHCRWNISPSDYFRYEPAVSDPLSENYFDDGGGYQNYCWTEHQRSESVSKWHSLDGKDLGSGSYMNCREFQPTASLINPDKETLAELWGNQGENMYEGYLGNESATKSTRYKRFAVIAWPHCQNIALASKIISTDGALTALTSAPDTIDALRSFMVSTAATGSSLTKFFTETMVTLLLKTADGDATLAQLFLDEVVDKVYDKKTPVPHLESLVKAFGWSATANSLSIALKRMTQKGSMSLQVVLELAAAVQSSFTDEVFAGIVATVVEIATSMLTHKLTDDPEPLKSIWKLTICCEADQMLFVQWANFVKRVDTSMLRDYVQAFDGLVAAKVDDGANSSGVAELVQSTLREIAKKRVDWDNTQRQTLT